MSDPKSTTTTTPPADMVIKNVLDVSDDVILHDPLYENPISFIKNVVGARAIPNSFRTRKQFYGRYITRLYENGQAGKEGDGMWDAVLSAIKSGASESIQETEIFVCVVHVEELQSFPFPAENDFKAIERIARNGGIFKSYTYALAGGEPPAYGDICLVSFNDPESRTEGMFEHPLAKGASSGPSAEEHAAMVARGGGRARRGYRDCRSNRSTREQARPPSGESSASQTQSNTGVSAAVENAVTTVVGGITETFAGGGQSTPPPAAQSTPMGTTGPEPDPQMSGIPEPTQNAVDGSTPQPKSAAERRRERRAATMATCKPQAPLSSLGQQYGIIDIRGQRTKVRKPRRPWSVINQVTLHQTACRLGERAERWKNVNVHFGVTRGGKIIYIEDIPHRQSQAQNFNSNGIGIEFDGWFAGVQGDIRTFWKPSSRTRDGRPRHVSEERKTPMEASQAQIDAGRKLIDFIFNEIKSNGGQLKFVQAHRQTSNSRRSCPGQIIWSGVGVWAQTAYDLSDGGNTFAVNNGRPIPKEWDPKRTASY